MNGNGQAREALTADMRQVLDDIDALVKAAANKAEGEVTVLRSRIRDQLGHARELTVQAQHEAVERARRAAGATNDYVHTHPWQAAGAGAAVGLAIGVLIGRR